MAESEQQVEAIINPGQSFFYGGGTPSPGARLTVSRRVAESWREQGMAEPANPEDLEGPANTAVDSPGRTAGENAPANATEGAVEKAAELGVEISDVEGSGEDGRILVKDVERHAAATRAEGGE